MTRTELLTLPVGVIMSRWPATIGIFIASRMHCVGCPIGMFHRLDDAAVEHGRVLEDLLDAIEDAIAGEVATDTLQPARRR